MLRCLLRMCGGDVISAWHSDGHVWVAWQCRRCGVIKHPTKTDVTWNNPRPRVRLVKGGSDGR